jgi:hypothetical protein
VQRFRLIGCEDVNAVCCIAHERCTGLFSALGSAASELSSLTDARKQRCDERGAAALGVFIGGAEPSVAHFSTSAGACEVSSMRRLAGLLGQRMDAWTSQVSGAISSVFRLSPLRSSGSSESGSGGGVGSGLSSPLALVGSNGRPRGTRDRYSLSPVVPPTTPVDGTGAASAGAGGPSKASSTASPDAPPLSPAALSSVSKMQRDESPLFPLLELHDPRRRVIRVAAAPRGSESMLGRGEVISLLLFVVFTV